MTAQNVVAFHVPERPHCWRQNELQQLVSLYSAHGSQRGRASWSVGKTETGDPQFYIVGEAPDLDCTMCVTRIGRLYVLEDGSGCVIAEDTRLDRIADAAARMLTKPHRFAFVARSLIGLCAFRVVLDQKLEFMLAESMEHVSRFVPQLAAFV
ncbi:hypothetical protein [Bradyrhizobium sp. LHD-71]|uniref:hypothetical protein n=1 Tax=Bradyrhizobium sp. LHD-71 TaxID=3072141 RepID=UPI00280D01A2|nr:hypothetical protein [Bradyrhizobium sp. LHD-71]MDQ8727139.1 hypothetical protein [Bradyrhizobium sp. LHD-71]